MLEELRPAPPAVRRAVELELVAAGCSAEVAHRLSDDVTVERHGGSELLCLLGNCVAAGQDAVELLVENVVADNAEATDRSARGEPGYKPLWPLPERRPRREYEPSAAEARREEQQHMRWLRRVFGMLEDGWPTRTPPTVPPAGPAVFHCPGCKRPVPVDARACPTCGKELVGTE